MVTPGTDSHWHILGAGAIGCLWASQLTLNNIPGTLLLRPERYRQLARQSLTYSEHGHDTELPATLGSTGNPGAISHLLVTTKAADALPALLAVQPFLTPEATIVLLQNGMGSQQRIARRFSEHAVYAGSTTDGAWKDGDLRVHRAGHGETWIGPINPTAAAAGASRLQPFAAIDDMSVTFTTSIEHRLLQKLAVNSVINGMTALYGCANGELLNPVYQQRLDQLCQETTRILAAEGYTSQPRLLEIVKGVLSITRLNISSTLQDVRNNRATELPWINGYLLERADHHKIPASAHRQLMAELQAKGVR